MLGSVSVKMKMIRKKKVTKKMTKMTKIMMTMMKLKMKKKMTKMTRNKIQNYKTKNSLNMPVKQIGILNFNLEKLWAHSEQRATAPTQRL